MNILNSILKIFRFVIILISGFIGVLLLFIGIQYATCPIYNFPDPEPFQGSHWYNPYENLSGEWYKANFHGHSISWFGATDGKDYPDMIFKHYHELGYAIVALSNYQHIQNFSTSLFHYPVYEHGYNVSKTHQLALGAHKVVWADYVFGQNLNHKQHIINTLQKHTELVALAHPTFQNGYSEKNMKYLSNYNLFEALNHYRFSLTLWDTLLANGKIAWIIGDDDTHNINDPRQTGVRWNMINSNSLKPDDVWSALKDGHCYAVAGKNGRLDNQLKSLHIQNNKLMLACQQQALKIIFIGNKGDTLNTFSNTANADFALGARDHYVRTEIFSHESTIYLNPVIRFDGHEIESASASVNHLATWIQRSGILLLLCLIVVGLRRIKSGGF